MVARQDDAIAYAVEVLHQHPPTTGGWVGRLASGEDIGFLLAFVGPECLYNRPFEEGRRIRWPSVLGFVADHSLDADDVAGPAAGVAPGVEHAAVSLPVLDGDAFATGYPSAAVGAEAGPVGQVTGPVGVPPVDTGDPRSRLRGSGVRQ